MAYWSWKRRVAAKEAFRPDEQPPTAFGTTCLTQASTISEMCGSTKRFTLEDASTAQCLGSSHLGIPAAADCR